MGDFFFQWMALVHGFLPIGEVASDNLQQIFHFPLNLPLAFSKGRKISLDSLLDIGYILWHMGLLDIGCIPWHGSGKMFIIGVISRFACVWELADRMVGYSGI